MATSNISITQTEFIEVAAAGAFGKVSSNSSALIHLVFSATKPEAGTTGHLIGNGDESEFVLSGNTDKCWAIVDPNAAGSATMQHDVTVTVGDSAGSSGGSGGSVDITTLSKEATQQQVLAAVIDADEFVSYTFTEVVKPDPVQEFEFDISNTQSLTLQRSGTAALGTGALAYQVSTDGGLTWGSIVDSNNLTISPRLRTFLANDGVVINYDNTSIATINASGANRIKFVSGTISSGETVILNVMKTKAIGYDVGELAAFAARTNEAIVTLAADVLALKNNVAYFYNSKVPQRGEYPIDLLSVGAVSDWIDVTGEALATKFELVLALTTASTVPAVALEMDYSYVGTAIVQSPSLTGMVNRAVSIGIDAMPFRVRAKVTAAGVALGAGASISIVRSN
jgi:hypothetical protein